MHPMPEMTAPTVRMVNLGATSGVVHAQRASYPIAGNLLHVHPEDVSTFEELGWRRVDPLPQRPLTDEERAEQLRSAQARQCRRIINPEECTRLAMAPGSKRSQECQGRSYEMPEEGFIDVPTEDVPFVTANTGWRVWGLVGPSECRPAQPEALVAQPEALVTFIDLTLGRQILFDGQNWRCPVTGAIV